MISVVTKTQFCHGGSIPSSSVGTPRRVTNCCRWGRTSRRGNTIRTRSGRCRTIRSATAGTTPRSAPTVHTTRTPASPSLPNSAAGQASMRFDRGGIGSTREGAEMPASPGSLKITSRSQRSRASRLMACAGTPSWRCFATRAITSASVSSMSRPAWSSTPASRSKRPTPTSKMGPLDDSTTRPTSRPMTSARTIPSSTTMLAPHRLIIATIDVVPGVVGWGSGSTSGLTARTEGAPCEPNDQTVISGATISTRRA